MQRKMLLIGWNFVQDVDNFVCFKRIISSVALLNKKILRIVTYQLCYSENKRNTAEVELGGKNQVPIAILLPRHLSQFFYMFF